MRGMATKSLPLHTGFPITQAFRVAATGPGTLEGAASQTGRGLLKRRAGTLEGMPRRLSTADQ
jgi:hypothetical protein